MLRTHFGEESKSLKQSLAKAAMKDALRNPFSPLRQQLAGNCLGLASMTGVWQTLVACVAGKEEGEERDAGLSMARHVSGSM